MAVRSPGPVLGAAGIQLRVVAQGQVDSPSYPISTGTFDLATHFHFVWPHGIGNYGGGWVSWDGSQLSLGTGFVTYFGNNPFVSSIGWSIIEVLNLNGPIQHNSVNITPSGSGLQSTDTAITAVPDYTKAIVIPHAFGQAVSSTGSGIFVFHSAYMTSNTNLRRRWAYNNAGGPFGTLSIPVSVVPCT